MESKSTKNKKNNKPLTTEKKKSIVEEKNKAVIKAEKKKTSLIATAIKKFDNKLFIAGAVVIILLGCFLIVRATGYGKVAKLSNGNDAIITLKNGKKISVDDFYKTVKDRKGRDILIEMIDMEIIYPQYEETEEENTNVKNQIDSIKQQVSGYFEEAIKYYYGVNNEAELEKLLRLEYRKTLAVKKYVSESLTEKEINDYYKSSIIGDINAKHILISPETVDGMTAEEESAANEKALKTAKEVIAKLQKGQDWDKLAKEYSDDTATKEKSGNLGWFNTGEMQEEFEKAAIKLEKGKYTTTPVKTTYGYHIIYKINQKEKPELKDVKADIKETLASKKLTDDATLTYVTLEKIRKEAGLTIEDGTMLKQYEKYMKQLKTSSSK